MPARSRQQVCILNELEAHAVEKDGFLADCRNHRHCGLTRALKEISSGAARSAEAKRIDSPRAIVVLPKEEDGGEWIPTHSAHRDFASLATMQFHARR